MNHLGAAVLTASHRRLVSKHCVGQNLWRGMCLALSVAGGCGEQTHKPADSALTTRTPPACNAYEAEQYFGPLLIRETRASWGVQLGPDLVEYDERRPRLFGKLWEIVTVASCVDPPWVPTPEKGKVREQPGYLNDRPGSRSPLYWRNGLIPGLQIQHRNARRT